MSDAQKTQKSTLSGRKPAYESRATEFRRELVTWKQTPESLRPSLHALADRLGTTHQMLSYFLKGLERWRAKENAKRIRARAEAEGRPMTMRECYDAIIAPAMLDKIEELRQAAKRGPLNHWDIKMLNLLAKQGFSGAKEVLVKCRQMTPQEERQARASERAATFSSAALKNIERIKQDAERGPLRWQDVEILKYFARRKHQGAKELLQEYSQSGQLVKALPKAAPMAAQVTQ